MNKPSRLERLMTAHPHLTEDGARFLLVKKGAELIEAADPETFSYTAINPQMEIYTDSLCRMTKDLLKLKLLELTTVVPYEDLTNDKEGSRASYTCI